MTEILLLYTKILKIYILGNVMQIAMQIVKKYILN